MRKKRKRDWLRSSTMDEVDEEPLPILGPADLAPGWEEEGSVLCIGGRTPLDEAAAAMLAGLLNKHGLKARVAESGDDFGRQHRFSRSGESQARLPVVSRHWKQLCPGTLSRAAAPAYPSLRLHHPCRLLDRRCDRRTCQGSEGDSRSRCLCDLASRGRGNRCRRCAPSRTGTGNAFATWCRSPRDEQSHGGFFEQRGPAECRAPTPSGQSSSSQESKKSYWERGRVGALSAGLWQANKRLTGSAPYEGLRS